MRTDSTLLSEDSNTDIGNYIERNFGKVYLSAEIIQYKSKIKNAQEAHEAIRPTHMTTTEDNLEEELSPETPAVYHLIWKRTAACQMSKGFKKKDIIIKDSLATMTLSGSQLIILGILKFYKREEEDEDSSLPPEIKGKNYSGGYA